MRALLAGTLLALAGCGTYQTREARDPLGAHSLIGMNVVDFIHGAGIPDKFLRTSDETMEMQYAYANADTGTTIGFLTAELKFGGPGSCKMTVTVLRDGTVADIDFPQSHVSGLGVPHSACSPLISELLGHPSSTGLPRGFDAFRLMGEGKGG